MNDQKEFAQLLAYLTGSKSEQELETAITTIGEEGLKKLATQYEQLKSAYNEVEQKKVMDEMKLTCEEYLTKKAKFGAKLNYIQALKNRCPEGTQLYKVGGRVECKKCGGSAKVKPTGKKRFLSEGGNAEFEQADVNQPIPRIEHVFPLKKTLITEVPYNSKDVKTKVSTIHFNSGSGVDPNSVSKITISTPQDTSELYTISPKISGFNNSKRAEQIYKAHQTNKKK